VTPKPRITMSATENSIMAPSIAAAAQARPSLSKALARSSRRITPAGATSAPG
jgi:hypothetical protein